MISKTVLGIVGIVFLFIFLIIYSAAADAFSTSVFVSPRPGEDTVVRSPQSVPEPASLTLLGVGAGAAWLARRRRK